MSHENPDTTSLESKASKETAAFDHLRDTTRVKMAQDLLDRIANNPSPTPEERSMGMYIEGLEPQVRTATLMMREKGYDTCSSGFFASDDSWRVLGMDNPQRDFSPLYRRAQFMDFRSPFQLPDETRERLGNLGVEIPEHPGIEGWVFRIGFVPESPDIEHIKAQWDTIADALPVTGSPIAPADSLTVAHSFDSNVASLGIGAEQLAASPLSAVGIQASIGAVGLGGVEVGG